MAEANKPGLLAKAHKRISRTKTKVLQTLGKADKYTDETFDDLVQKTEKQHEVAHHLQKEIKSYVHCIRALSNASKSLAAALSSTYEEEWTDEMAFKKSLESQELLWTDYLDSVQSSVTEPMNSYLASFPPLKAKIAKRGRKMVDFDNSRHNLEVLQAAKKKDETKIAKANDELNESRRIFDDLHNELCTELPDFYNKRVTFYAGLFQKLFGCENTLHTELARISDSLTKTADALSKDHVQFVYTPKRTPSSLQFDNCEDHPVNGDFSPQAGADSPSTPTAPTAAPRPSTSATTPVTPTSTTMPSSRDSGTAFGAAAAVGGAAGDDEDPDHVYHNQDAVMAAAKVNGDAEKANEILQQQQGEDVNFAVTPMETFTGGPPVASSEDQSTVRNDDKCLSLAALSTPAAPVSSYGDPGVLSHYLTPLPVTPTAPPTSTASNDVPFQEGGEGSSCPPLSQVGLKEKDCIPSPDRDPGADVTPLYQTSHTEKGNTMGEAQTQKEATTQMVDDTECPKTTLSTVTYVNIDTASPKSTFTSVTDVFIDNSYQQEIDTALKEDSASLQECNVQKSEFSSSIHTLLSTPSTQSVRNADFEELLLTEIQKSEVNSCDHNAGLGDSTSMVLVGGEASPLPRSVSVSISDFETLPSATEKKEVSDVVQSSARDDLPVLLSDAADLSREVVDAQQENQDVRTGSSLDDVYEDVMLFPSHKDQLEQGGKDNVDSVQLACSSQIVERCARDTPRSMSREEQGALSALEQVIMSAACDVATPQTESCSPNISSTVYTESSSLYESMHMCTNRTGMGTEHGGVGVEEKTPKKQLNKLPSHKYDLIKPSNETSEKDKNGELRTPPTTSSDPSDDSDDSDHPDKDSGAAQTTDGPRPPTPTRDPFTGVMLKPPVFLVSPYRLAPGEKEKRNSLESRRTSGGEDSRKGFGHKGLEMFKSMLHISSRTKHADGKSGAKVTRSAVLRDPERSVTQGEEVKKRKRSSPEKSPPADVKISKRKLTMPSPPKHAGVKKDQNTDTTEKAQKGVDTTKPQTNRSVDGNGQPGGAFFGSQGIQSSGQAGGDITGIQGSMAVDSKHEGGISSFSENKSSAPAAGDIRGGSQRGPGPQQAPTSFQAFLDPALPQSGHNFLLYPVSSVDTPSAGPESGHTRHEAVDRSAAKSVPLEPVAHPSSKPPGQTLNPLAPPFTMPSSSALRPRSVPASGPGFAQDSGITTAQPEFGTHGSDPAPVRLTLPYTQVESQGEVNTSPDKDQTVSPAPFTKTSAIRKMETRSEESLQTPQHAISSSTNSRSSCLMNVLRNAVYSRRAQANLQQVPKPAFHRSSFVQQHLPPAPAPVYLRTPYHRLQADLDPRMCEPGGDVVMGSQPVLEGSQNKRLVKEELERRAMSQKTGLDLSSQVEKASKNGEGDVSQLVSSLVTDPVLKPDTAGMNRSHAERKTRDKHSPGRVPQVGNAKTETSSYNLDLAREAWRTAWRTSSVTDKASSENSAAPKDGSPVKTLPLVAQVESQASTHLQCSEGAGLTIEQDLKSHHYKNIPSSLSVPISIQEDTKIKTTDDGYIRMSIEHSTARRASGHLGPAQEPMKRNSYEDMHCLWTNQIFQKEGTSQHIADSGQSETKSEDCSQREEQPQYNPDTVQRTVADAGIADSVDDLTQSSELASAEPGEEQSIHKTVEVDMSQSVDNGSVLAEQGTPYYLKEQLSANSSVIIKHDGTTDHHSTGQLSQQSDADLGKVITMLQAGEVEVTDGKETSNILPLNSKEEINADSLQNRDNIQHVTEQADSATPSEGMALDVLQTAAETGVAVASQDGAKKQNMAQVVTDVPKMAQVRLHSEDTESRTNSGTIQQVCEEVENTLETDSVALIKEPSGNDQSQPDSVKPYNASYSAEDVSKSHDKQNDVEPNGKQHNDQDSESMPGMGDKVQREQASGDYEEEQFGKQDGSSDPQILTSKETDVGVQYVHSSDATCRTKAEETLHPQGQSSQQDESVPQTCEEHSPQTEESGPAQPEKLPTGLSGQGSGFALEHRHRCSTDFVEKSYHVSDGFEDLGIAEGKGPDELDTLKDVTTDGLPDVCDTKSPAVDGSEEGSIETELITLQNTSSINDSAENTEIPITETDRLSCSQSNMGLSSHKEESLASAGVHDSASTPSIRQNITTDTTPTSTVQQLEFSNESSQNVTTDTAPACTIQQLEVSNESSQNSLVSDICVEVRGCDSAISTHWEAGPSSSSDTVSASMNTEVLVACDSGISTSEVTYSFTDAFEGVGQRVPSGTDFVCNVEASVASLQQPLLTEGQQCDQDLELQGESGQSLQIREGVESLQLSDKTIQSLEMQEGVENLQLRDTGVGKVEYGNAGMSACPVDLQEVDTEQTALEQMAAEQTAFEQMAAEQTALEQMAAEQTAFEQMAGEQTAFEQMAAEQTENVSFTCEDFKEMMEEASALRCQVVETEREDTCRIQSEIPPETPLAEKDFVSEVPVTIREDSSGTQVEPFNADSTQGKEHSQDTISENSHENEDKYPLLFDEDADGQVSNDENTCTNVGQSQSEINKKYKDDANGFEDVYENQGQSQPVMYAEYNKPTRESTETFSNEHQSQLIKGADCDHQVCYPEHSESEDKEQNCSKPELGEECDETVIIAEGMHRDKNLSQREMDNKSSNEKVTSSEDVHRIQNQTSSEIDKDCSDTVSIAEAMHKDEHLSQSATDKNYTEEVTGSEDLHRFPNQPPSEIDKDCSDIVSSSTEDGTGNEMEQKERDATNGMLGEATRDSDHDGSEGFEVLLYDKEDDDDETADISAVTQTAVDCDMQAEGGDTLQFQKTESKMNALSEDSSQNKAGVGAVANNVSEDPQGTEEDSGDDEPYQIPTSNKPVYEPPPTTLYEVEATHTYNGEDVDELSFDPGDIIYVVPFENEEEQDEGWQMGIKQKDGMKGVFPENFTRRV